MLRPSTVFRTLAVASVIAIAAPACMSLGAQRLLAYAHHSSWGESDGLAYAAMNRVMRSPDGYLWMSGEGALVRFDGVRFTAFDGANTPALVSAGAGGLALRLIDRDGTMWVARRDGALVRYRNGRFQVALRPLGARRFVTFLAQDGSGRIWAIIANGGLHYIDGDSLLPAPLPPGIPGTEPAYLIADGTGGVLIGTHNKGIVHLTPHGSVVYPRPPLQRAGATRPLLQAQDGSIWAFAAGLQVFRNGSWTYLAMPGTGEQFIPTAATESPNGVVWVTTRGHGVLRFANGRMEQFTKHDGLSDAVAYDIAVDEEGSAWIATEAGLDRLRSAPFALLNRSHGLPFDTPHWISPDVRGAIWALSFPGARLYQIDSGIVRGDAGRMTFWSPRDTTAHDYGPFAVARAGGVWTYDQRARALTRVVAGRDKPAEVISRVDRAIVFENRRGELWTSPDRGRLQWLSLGQWHSVASSSNPDSSTALEMTEDDKGRMVLVLLGAPNLVVLADGQVVNRLGVKDGIAQRLKNVLADGADTLWAIDPDSSLYRITGAKVSRLTSPELVPLVRGRSTALLRAGDRLFIASTAGIVSVSRADLNAAADRRAQFPPLRRYSALDGAHTARLTVGNIAPAFRAGDGRLWFSTPGGLLVYDSRNDVPNPVAPRVHIEEVRAVDSVLARDSIVRVPAGAERVQFKFTVTALRVPERARLEFRLEGVDVNWRPADATRTVTYTQLRPDRYSFRVRAWNEDGVPAVAEAVLPLRVMPLWHQSWWFISLMVLAAIGATAGAVALVLRARQRVVAARLAAGFEATLAERTRLAGELHDTLLQAFTGVTLQLQALRSRIVAAPQEVERDIGRVLTVADGALREARSAVWDMRAPELEGRDVAAALEDSAKSAVDAHVLAGGSPVELVVTVSGRRRRVAPAIETAAHRIGREAVANALRHASAKVISLTIDFEPRHLCLEVRDNGVGFDVSAVSPTEGKGHWGLVGMRERAGNAGGSLEVASVQGSGTVLVVRLPVASA